jgi:hypothetical protein
VFFRRPSADSAIRLQRGLINSIFSHMIMAIIFPD